VTPLFLALALSTPAHAEVVRHALVVGHNLGTVDEVPLLFAEDDAQLMARTLVGASGTRANHTTTLVSPTRNQLLHALANLREAVAEDTARGADTLVLFFYSGHADATGMHLGRQDLSWDELQTLLDRTNATVRVAFLDACQSGAMAESKGLRTKGATRAPAFAVELSDRLTASGQVVLTSSAADQVSHESDALGGSFFTHHLASALAGAADANADGQVTLDEAWAHVARETAYQTRDQRRGSQTPTYAWDLKGTGQLVLTAPGRGAATLGFPAGLSGEFAVFDLERRAFVARVVLDGTERRSVGLASGDYIIQQRLPDHLEVARVRLSDGDRVELEQVGFDTVSYEDDVIKGALDAKSRRARRPELSATVGLTSRSYDDPADGVLDVPSTAGVGVDATATWTNGIRLGVDLTQSSGAGAVRPDVAFSVGAAEATTFTATAGWLTAPRVWRVGATAHLTRLSYVIDYPEYDLGDPQSLRTMAPGLGVVLGVYPGSMSIEARGRAHEVRYEVDGVPAGIRFADLSIHIGVRR